MALREFDAIELAKSQRESIGRIFRAEVPRPADSLFELLDRIRSENLFTAEPFYLPRRQLVHDIIFPELEHSLDPWLYEQIGAGKVAADADCLPGQWIILDVTRRPDKNDGKQMYADTNRFKDLLAGLRDQGKIRVSDNYKNVPKDSRFAVRADDIDGNGGFVAKEVAAILELDPRKITTPAYSTFNFVGNLAHPEFGQVNTFEWLSDRFDPSSRLYGGNADYGGLSFVYCSLSVTLIDDLGFRLQVNPSCLNH